MQGNVMIVGLGLIGGSLALAIKKQHSEARIYGYDIQKSEIETAKALQVIDEVANSLRQGAELADVIILSAPVLQLENLLIELANFNLKENVLITDTGSTKMEIMKLANELWPEESVTFIGGHPMAGSHKSGVASAKSHLFENAYYILTPSSMSADRIEELKQWLEGTNSHFLVLETEEHDYVTGVISHLPHVMAAGLVNQAKKHAERNPLISLLAAGGFRDITRIASGNPEMWKDIVKQNQVNLLALLDDWMGEMQNFRHILEKGDDPAVSHYFEVAKEYRDSLPIHSKGAIPSYYDLYVDVMDVPGTIAGITTLLAKQGISLTNLNIIENREGLIGVLRISFEKDKDRTKAQGLLKYHGYHVSL
ncbi:prephenate dehydrogenase [Ornithinibacillus sp. L9]|uniref:Prephenate dehydrogenase n=1 Tax=Ornithinibacillus caprae TaxID=2678566 RepID=A0A6N8FE54_9BACI|nr:prephenate dehydrogenase [Ornithinibacillus caprae]MUK87481.1 prephenate dehydrogenase [Ornithinibacillus caprae]